MRERYEDLELEVIEFDTEDVITGSPDRYEGQPNEIS